jgi:hypothetical protein
VLFDLTQYLHGGGADGMLCAGCLWHGAARHGAVPAVEGAHPPPPNKKTKPSEAAAQTVEKGCGGAAPPAGAEAEEEDEDQEKEKEKEKASEASSAGCPR